MSKKERFAIVSKARKKHIKISNLLVFAEVNRSSYYKFEQNKDNKFQKDRKSYELIKDICNSKKNKCGIRTIQMILLNKYNIYMNLKKIARIKRDYDIPTIIRKKNVSNIAFKKGLEHRTADNLLKQDFKANQPDKIFSTDISYLPYYGGQRAYLSATKDLATKEIIAFNVSTDLGLNNTFESLKNVLSKTNIQNLIIHSDQGFHYTHPYYIKMLKDYGVTQSMSRKGNCLDNAPIESFFGHMKDEIELKTCKTFEDVKNMIENYINYCNNERYQWGLKKMTPAKYRCHLLESSTR